MFIYLHKKFQKITTNIEIVGASSKSILSLEETMGLKGSNIYFAY